MKKDLFKHLIAKNQADMPYQVIDRDEALPVEKKKIITVPGVRRCGKSSEMKIAINSLMRLGVPKERILWMGFDDERLMPLQQDDFDDIIRAYMEMYPDVDLQSIYIFFDEIQLVKGWEYFVLRLYKSYCQNIFISGSNASMLSTELVSALRGYPLEYKVYPLSFHEYCRFLGIPTEGWLETTQVKGKVAFEEYVSASAFPEVVLESNPGDKVKILQGYYDTMLLKDVGEHYGISNLKVLRYLAKRLMGNLSKPTSINAIYNDIKSQGLAVSRDDLYDWTDNLCNIFLFFKLPQFTKSLKTNPRRLNKIYCVDNGLRQAVLAPLSEDKGKLLENSVYLQLLRKLQPFEHLSYFKGEKECDFVVQREDTVTQLMQVTWDLSKEGTRQREIDGLLEASRATHCDNMVIIDNELEETISLPGNRSIRVIPAYKWFLGWD